MVSSTAIQKFEAILNPDPFSAYDCFLFLEAWRIFSLSLVFWNFTMIYVGMVLLPIYGGQSVGPFHLETSLWILGNYFVNDFLPSTFSVFTHSGNSHYIEIGLPGLSLNLLLFCTIFTSLSLCSTFWETSSQLHLPNNWV